MEKSLIIIKPDGLQRGLVGEIITRFEKKGLRLAAIKMIAPAESHWDEHYAHHRNKPFFVDLKKFMMSSPVIAMVIEGVEAVEAVRKIVGETNARKAEAGSIRGDFGMSHQLTLVHASDSVENAKQEIERFFEPAEIHDYQKIDYPFVYSKDELE